MANKCKEVKKTLKELLPYKDVIILVIERRVKDLEFNAFRYGGAPSSGQHKSEQHYNKIIETKKIKNLLVTLFHDAENLLDK